MVLDTMGRRMKCFDLDHANDEKCWTKYRRGHCGCPEKTNR